MSKTNLILLPGMDGTGMLFRSLVANFSEQVQTRIISYPADKFLNYQQLTEYVLEKLPSKEPYVILAESFSGLIALNLAEHYPDQTLGLILCAAFVTNPLPLPANCLTRMFISVAFNLPIPFIAVRYFLLGWDSSSELVQLFFQAFNSVKRRILIRRALEVMELDAVKLLKNCRKPVLCLQPENDRLVGRKMLDQILLLNPSVIVKKINGPHLLLQVKAAEAAQAIEEFIQRLLTGQQR